MNIQLNIRAFARPTVRHGGGLLVAIFIALGALIGATPVLAAEKEKVDLAVPERSKAVGGQWSPQGPAPISFAQVENITPNDEAVGAIHTVAPDPSRPDVLYVGSVNGGVWKTTNANAAQPTWRALTDKEASSAIGALEFDPTDKRFRTLVAGIGRYSSFGRLGGNRTGLLKTTNGGTDWRAIDGGLAGKNISGVAPRGDTIVVSVNVADAFTFGNIGIFRSTDDGASFTRVSGEPGSGLPLGLSYDLVSDPNNQSRLFTNADFADFAGGVNGIYRSDDTGATWIKVSDPIIDALLISQVTSNVELAVGEHGNVYAAVVNAGSLAGLFRSGSGGDPGSWVALDLPATGPNNVGLHPGGQGSIHNSIVADPSDENIVYIGGDRQPFTAEEGLPFPPQFPNSIGAVNFSARLFRVDASQPPGSQAQPITHVNTASNSSPHADSREMKFNSAGELIETNDGGIYKLPNPRSDSSDWLSINGNIQTTEVHDGAYDDVAGVLVAGLQDNGTPMQFEFNDREYFLWVGGDGGDVAIDDTSTPGVSIRYTSSQFLGAFNRSFWDENNDLLGFAFVGLAPTAGSNPIAGQFSTPMELNGVDATRIVIGGGNSVYESLDQGDTITEVGPGIVANGTGFDAIGYGYPGNPDFMMVGAGDQVFSRSGAALSLLALNATYPAAGSGLTVRDIVIDQDTGATFVVNREQVWMTSDEGTTWSDISGNIQGFDPQALRAVVYVDTPVGDALVVSSFNGIFIAKDSDGFSQWLELGLGLPNAPVLDLDYSSTDFVINAHLLGRGNWSLSPRGF